jgi:hypothetical protein
VATHEMLLAAAGSTERLGEILSALFPPAAMAVVFVLICRAALRSTDWKKPEDGAEPAQQSRGEKHPREPDGAG